MHSKLNILHIKGDPNQDNMNIIAFLLKFPKSAFQGARDVFIILPVKLETE